MEMKRIVLFCLTALVVIKGSFSIAQATSQLPVLLESTPITSGATREVYAWETSAGRSIIHVIKVDLNDPYVVLDAISKDQKIAQRAGLSTIAKSNDAIAAINADFFNMQAEGAPIGIMISQSNLMSSPSKLEHLFAIGIDDSRTAHIDSFTFSGSVTASNGSSFQLSGLNKTTYWEEPVSSHSHSDKLHIYNDAWGRAQRGHDGSTTPTEVVVRDGIVLSIHIDEYFPGMVPEGAYILRGHRSAAEFLKTLRVGEPVLIDYSISPNRNWSMVMGGHSLLVDEGKAVPYKRSLGSANTLAARSAAGISRDGKTVYLVAVERNSVTSNGISLGNLSAFFEYLGAWKAVNLDGGGSTTMVSRPLGSFETVRVFTPSEGTERSIANAIGIFSTAPRGDIKGIEIQGPRHLLLNQELSFSFKTYDQFYNPINLSALSADWTISNGLGHFDGNVLKVTTRGTGEVEAKVGALASQREVQVLGHEDIKSLSVALASGNQGDQVLKVTLRTHAGANVNVPANLINWSFHGVSGSVSKDGKLNVFGSDKPTVGMVIAEYDGFKAPFVLQFSGEKQAMALNSLNGVTFETHPTGVLGGLRIVGNPSASGESVIELAYDFGDLGGTKAVYLRFNGSGLRLEPLTERISMDIYGQGKGEWVRAEILDGNNELHRLDFAKTVNWTGWRNTQIDVSNLAHPLTLRRIYVVGTDQTTHRKGNLLFKNIVNHFGSENTSVKGRPQVELTINKKEMKIDGTKKAIDVAPVMKDGRTMVPIRFVSEAFGASVQWDPESQSATVIKGRNLVVLAYESDEMLVNGSRVKLDVKPQLINNRMMIPLRAVVESLDIKVHWDPETQSIILR